MKYRLVNKIQNWLRNRMLERLSNAMAAADYINAKRTMDQGEYLAFKNGLKAAEKIIRETTLI